jgi:hypothetical protein
VAKDRISIEFFIPTILLRQILKQNPKVLPVRSTKASLASSQAAYSGAKMRRPPRQTPHSPRLGSLSSADLGGLEG